MRLTADETTELKKQKPCKAWRAVEPPYAEPGKSYRSGGQEYTVVSVELLSDGDILRRFGKAEYATLNERFGEGQLWLVVIVAGDRTDKPRHIHWSGRGGNERGYGDLFLGHKKTMSDMEAVADVDLNQFAAQAQAASEEKRFRRKLPKRIRHPKADKQERETHSDPTYGVGWPD